MAEYVSSKSSLIKLYLDNLFTDVTTTNNESITIFSPKFYFDANENLEDRISYTFYRGTDCINYGVTNEADAFWMGRYDTNAPDGDGSYSLKKFTVEPTIAGVGRISTSEIMDTHYINSVLQNKDWAWFQTSWKDVKIFYAYFNKFDFSAGSPVIYDSTITDDSSDGNYSYRYKTRYVNLAGNNILNYDYVLNSANQGTYESINRGGIGIKMPELYYVDRGYGYEVTEIGDNRATPLKSERTYKANGSYVLFDDNSTDEKLRFDFTQTQLEVELKLPATATLTRSSSKVVTWTDLGSFVYRYDIYIDDELATSTTNTAYTLPDTYKGLHKIRIRPIANAGYYEVTNKSYCLYGDINYTDIIDRAFTIQVITFFESPAATEEVTIGQIETPTVTLNSRTSINTASISWTTPDSYKYDGHACHYQIHWATTDLSGNIKEYYDTTLNNTYTINNLKKSNGVSVRVIDEVDSLNTSKYGTLSFNLSAIQLPSFTYTRTAYNEVTYYWTSAITYCDKLRFTVNGTLFTTSGTTNQSNTSQSYYITTDLIKGTNQVGIQCISEVDSEFDSNIIITSPVLDQLAAPVITYTDYPDSNPNNAYVELSWEAVAFAKGYVIYDDYNVYNATTNAWDTGTNSDSEYSGTTSIITKDIKDTSTTQGNHKYYVKAIIDDESEFNSDVSNTFEYNHSILEPPVISYRGDTSIVEWEDSDDSNIDRFLITTYANGISDTVATVTKGTDKLEYNVYNAVKNPYNITLTYNTYVTSMSNNAFYYYPSKASNVLADYQAIVLGKATPTYDYDTGIISWNSVTNARGYLLTIKSTNGTSSFTLDANTTTYDISTYTQDLYTISVQALGSQDSTTDRPYYLNSWEIGMISVGILNPPVISRKNNILSWETVGADYYDIYQNDIKIRTVNDGTSTTANKTVKAILDAVPVGTYTYKVKGYYRGTDGELFESNYSNVLSVTVTQLDAPEIYFENGLSIVHWNSVSNAEEYDIYVGDDDVVVHTDLNNLVHSVTKDESSPTYYPVTIKSVNNNDHFAYLDSEDSNELKYYVYILGVPTLSLDTTNKRLTWTEVEHANFYTLTINNQDSAVSAAYYDVSTLEANTYTAYVKASSSSTLYSNPRYLQSKSSNIVTFGTLDTPVISVYNNTERLVWDEIENADYYDIYNDGVYLTSTTFNYFTLVASEPTKFTIYIVARSDSENIFDSNASNTVQFSFVRLDTPQNFSLKDSNNIVSWTPVANAKGYALYNGTKLIANLYNGETSYNLTEYFKDTVGKQTLYVIALGKYVSATSGYVYYLNSESSNVINKLVYPTQKYNIMIDGVNYTSIQLPFSFTATIDETLDTCNLIINHTTRKEPFEAYSEAVLNIYDDSLLSPDIYQNMLVATDDVTDVMVGTTTYYNHSVSLVERTRLLQSEIMPSFSVTQPEAVVNSTDYDLAEPKLVSGTYLWNHTDKCKHTETTTMVITDLPWYKAAFASWFNGGLIGEFLRREDVYYGCHCNWTSIKKEYKNGETTILPIETGEPGWFIYYSWFGANYGDVSKEDQVTTTRHYYIRNHCENAAYNSAYPETELESVQGPDKSVIWDTSKFGIGDYDIILEIDDITDYFGNKFGLMSTVSNSSQETLGFLSDLQGCSHIYEETNLWNPSGIKIRNTAHYRVVWNVKVVDAYTESDEKITIADTLNKIVDILEPIDVNETARYSIDPKILGMTQTLQCPELAIEKGKTLYEVLSILGKEFNGIPRLKKDNVITYDILNQTTSFDIGTNGFRNPDVEEQSGSSIDNHATGFISNVSNLVSDTCRTIYPAGEIWTTARADNAESIYVDNSSMIVQTDQPIYKFCNLFVKNVFKNNADAVVDLTDYVYEKTLYDALNDDRDGKGKALYYEQGSNKICGFGEVPAASELYETLGWSEDSYVIQNIINSQYGLIDMGEDKILNASFLQNWGQYYNQICDFEYKVVYKPVIDTVSYIEQSTITDLANYNYKNFNQEDNVVSDSRLFKSADEQLKRLGNNSIQKLYTTTNLNEVPLLGYQTTIDDDVYYIDSVTYEFNNKYIDSQVNYSKNINKINERVGVDSAYRQYEIYGGNWIDRTLNFNDYCFIDFKSYDISDSLSVNNWPDILVKGLYGDGTKTDPEVKPDAFYINACKDKYGNKITWTKKAVYPVTAYADGILLSASGSYGLNSVQFSAAMVDNFSAGVAASEKVKDATTDWDTQKAVQSDVRYVNDKGKCDYMKVTLTRIDTDLSEKLQKLSTNIAATLPACRWTSHPETTFKDTAVFQKNIKLEKDNRERICFNYQMHFISRNKSIYIHNGLTKRLFKNPSIRYVTEVSSLAKPIWIGYRTPILSKNVFTDVIEKVGDFNITKSSDNKHLIINGFDYNTNGSSYIGYALMWPTTGELLLDVRLPLDGTGTTDDIYLSLSDSRI